MDTKTAIALLDNATVALTEGPFAGTMVRIVSIKACPNTTKATNGAVVAAALATSDNANMGYMINVMNDGSLVVVATDKD